MEKKAQTTKMRLIEAALDRFVKQGFKKTTLAELASDVGVVKSAVYNYFPSKEALLQEVINSFSQEFIARARKALRKPGNLRDKLERLQSCSFDFQKETIAERHIPVERWTEFLPLLIEHERDQHHSESFLFLYEEVLEEGVRNGEIVLAAFRDHAQLLNMMSDQMFGAFYIGSMTEKDCRRLQSVMIDTMLDGLRPRGNTK